MLWQSFPCLCTDSQQWMPVFNHGREGWGPVALLCPAPQLCADHTWENGFSSVFAAVTGCSVCSTCSGLLCIAFVVYRGVVGYKMGLEWLGQVHSSGLTWKMSYGRLWAAGNCSSCRRMWLSQHSLKYPWWCSPVGLRHLQAKIQIVSWQVAQLLHWGLLTLLCEIALLSLGSAG